MRLESILPFPVHHSQNAFIKGRSIFDAIRTIDDILEYAKKNNRPGILVAIDFEKAFDSLNQTFLVKVLQKFNFGTYFLQCIRTFYTNLSSCVLNNGSSPPIFSLSAVVSDKVIRFQLCYSFYLWKYLHVTLDKIVISTA